MKRSERKLARRELFSIEAHEMRLREIAGVVVGREGEPAILNREANESRGKSLGFSRDRTRAKARRGDS